MASDCEVKEGVAVELSIALPDSSSANVETTGRVVWVNSNLQRKKAAFPAGFGIESVEFKEKTEDIFMAFMSNYIPAACVQE